MDNTAAKSDSNLDAGNLNSGENVKRLDPAPARSSAKSCKGKIDTKAIIKNKLAPTVESKSTISLAKSGEQLKKATIFHAAKSSSSSTLPGKTRIPGRRKSAFGTTITAGEQKPEELQLKLQPENRSTSKSSIGRLELTHAKVMASVTSQVFRAPKPGNVRLVNSNQQKRVPKCNSARLSSETSASSINKRSDSNISTHSTPCARIKDEKEINLRKMMSVSGDYNKNDTIDKGTSLDAKDNSESVDEFKSNMKKFMEKWFADKSYSCDVEQLEVLKSNGILSFIDDFCTKANDIFIDKFKKDIEKRDKCIDKLEQNHKDLTIQHEIEMLKLGRDLAEKAEINMARKDEDIKELQKKSKTQEKHINTIKTTVQNLEKEKEQLQSEKNGLQEEIKCCRDSNAALTKKLAETEQQVKQEKRDIKCKIDIIKKLESDLAEKKKIESELAEMTTKLEELQDNNKKAHSESIEHLKQISELTSRLDCLEADKETLQRQNEKLERDINSLDNVHEKLLEAENKIQDLQTELDNKETSVETIPEYSKEVQMEFAKYRQAEVERCQEIDKLKTELSKAQYNICQLEKQIESDQRLLDVRSNIINSLQTNEKTQRIHIEELYVQVQEKNNAINELTCELQTKNEEFQKLLAALNTKKIELGNQEHIIKLLEESNERSQMLRVKQEEKIGRLEEELTHLKHTIAIYQANIITENNGKHVVKSPAFTLNENVYYHTRQHKRKRQVDINVKKYEA